MKQSIVHIALVVKDYDEAIDFYVNKLQSESVFIDDMPYNVKGAESVGISAIQFENSAQCERALKALGLSF